MSSINFDNPWLLLIAVPLVILFAVPFAIAVRKDNVNAHNVTSAVLHLLMALCIALAAAGTYIVTTVTETDVYVLADVSYSANLNLDTVDSYIDDLQDNLPDNSYMGVVCFGRDQKITTKLGEKFTTVKDSPVDDSYTDIVGALHFAGTLFKSGVIKRVVLITDGRATDGTDASDIQSQVNALAERDIRVDAIFLDDNLSDETTELQLSSVDVTSSVTLNKEETCALTVQVNCAEDEELYPVITLYRNDEEYKRATPSLVNGNNSVSFTLYTAEEGVYEYRAVIEYDGDFNLNNNEISFTQTVSGKLKTLLIAGSNRYSDAETIKGLCGENAEVDSYIGLTAVPYTVEELCVYDQIILSDVDASTLDHFDMFVSSLDTVVSVYGKSLITFGNTYIQSHTDGTMDDLSGMLPVVYGESEGEDKFYTLLIDTSRSMKTTYKLARAKEAAIEVLNLLNSDDKVAIVEFSGDSSIAYEPAYVGTNKADLISKINNLGVSQGTVISAGLEQAFGLMRAGDYSEKRVILITDGLNGVGGSSDPVSIVREMRAYSIYTTVMDVGRANDTGESATTAKNLLNEIASVGGGEVLDISTDDALENVVINELPQEVTSAEGGVSAISVNRLRDDVLDGLDLSAFGASGSSYVRGYIKSAAKANAYTVLNVYYAYTSESSNSTTYLTAPLYAYWKYGNGKVSSFSSTLNGNWVDSIEDDVRTQLFANIISTNIPEEKTDYPYLFEVTRDTGTAEITVKPSALRNDGWAEITVIDPTGEKTTGDMAFGTSSYDYSIVTASEGCYTITVTYGYGERGSSSATTFTATKYVHVSYSDEYDSFALYDASSLIRGVGANGKVSTDGSLVIENDPDEVGQYFYYFTIPLLIAAVVLYAIDIGVRKLKWEDIKSIFKRSKAVKKDEK